jgi:hypothetical protein
MNNNAPIVLEAKNIDKFFYNPTETQVLRAGQLSAQERGICISGG